MQDGQQIEAISGRTAQLELCCLCCNKRFPLMRSIQYRAKLRLLDNFKGSVFLKNSTARVKFGLLSFFCMEINHTLCCTALAVTKVATKLVTSLLTVVVLFFHASCPVIAAT